MAPPVRSRNRAVAWSVTALLVTSAVGGVVILILGPIVGTLVFVFGVFGIGMLFAIPLAIAGAEAKARRRALIDSQRREELALLRKIAAKSD